jgi:hypothetical protein
MALILRCSAKPGLEGCSSGCASLTILRGSLREHLRMRLLAGSKKAG